MPSAYIKDAQPPPHWLRLAIRRLVPQNGDARHPPFRGYRGDGYGTGKEVKEMRLYRRLAASLGSIVALLLAGGAHWKVP